MNKILYALLCMGLASTAASAEDLVIDLDTGGEAATPEVTTQPEISARRRQGTGYYPKPPQPEEERSQM